MILSLLKSKCADSNYITDGEIQIKIIDGLKKEFKVFKRKYCGLCIINFINFAGTSQVLDIFRPADLCSR